MPHPHHHPEKEHTKLRSAGDLSMALRREILAAIDNPASAACQAATPGLRPLIRSDLACGTGRRAMLSLLLVSTATIPEASNSKNALLQEYLKRSKENKAKNDKERLDDYYKRNYRDYFQLIEGSAEKNEEQLTESEKGIRAWLQKNR